MIEVECGAMGKCEISIEAGEGLLALGRQVPLRGRTAFAKAWWMIEVDDVNGKWYKKICEGARVVLCMDV